MKAQIIQIGNSQGIRIPKVLLEESKISGEVELVVHEDGILIRNISQPRSGWDAMFRAMAENDEDHILEPQYRPTDFEKREWQW